ncbi:hypothetical protein ACLCDV_07975 [Sphingobacterium sp. Lzh-3]|uniref:hypothetical protein n=1 Tax=Sphingobacterium sp. Lzh-3 TaxID=3382150 RepID=UPI00398D61C5
MFYKVISTAALLTFIVFVFKFNSKTSVANDKYVFLNDGNTPKAINKENGNVFIYIPKYGWATYHEAQNNIGELPEDKLKKLP